MQTTPIHKYGWKHDKDDKRDKLFKYTREVEMNFPPRIDLRERFKLPDAYDQETLGSCTANAIAFAYQYADIKQDGICDMMPSRLFIYYNERVIEGTVNEDSGAELRDGIKTINRDGACDEIMWIYDISKFAIKPPKICYNQAKKCKSVFYERVHQSMNSLKQVIFDGYPFVFGFQVYKSLESPEVAQTGIMPLPVKGKDIHLGGHAVTCVGYDDNKIVAPDVKGAWIIRNSWGPKWADNGYFYMPYEYMINPDSASDFWVIKTITSSLDKKTNSSCII